MKEDRDGEEEGRRGIREAVEQRERCAGSCGVTLCDTNSLSVLTPSSLFPPSFSPSRSLSLSFLQVCVKVTLLNFAITPQGLEEQLLGALIKTELPEVEEANATLVLDNARMKKVRGRT